MDRARAGCLAGWFVADGTTRQTTVCGTPTCNWAGGAAGLMQADRDAWGEHERQPRPRDMTHRERLTADGHHATSHTSNAYKL